MKRAPRPSDFDPNKSTLLRSQYAALAAMPEVRMAVINRITQAIAGSQVPLALLQHILSELEDQKHG